MHSTITGVVFRTAALLLLALSARATLAETAQEAKSESKLETRVKQLIQAKLGEKARVDSVRQTPYSGLFEINADNEIFYTDAQAKYMFAGHVIDTTSFKDYTALRLEETSRVRFSDLPLKAALKQVKGNGSRTIAVFEDPNCGYCKKFRQTLQSLDNVTIYTFLYNILADDSVAKSNSVWCAPDPVQAWDDWMLSGKLAAGAPSGCTAPNDQVLMLGKKMRVTGTPTVVFSDGSRLQGVADKATIEKKLVALK